MPVYPVAAHEHVYASAEETSDLFSAVGAAVAQEFVGGGLVGAAVVPVGAGVVPVGGKVVGE